MDQITLRIPVVVKAKVTQTLKDVSSRMPIRP